MEFPAFPLPDVPSNSDGWGPSTVPEHLKEVPFAPFNKGDKLGRASDWTQSNFQKFQGRYPQGGATAVFNFLANEEEENFHLVDNRPVKAPKFGQRRFQQKFVRRDQGKGGPEPGDKGKKGQQQQQLQGKRQPWQQFGRDQQRIQYSCSVDIRPEWAVVEQIPFTSLAKLSCNVGDAEDIVRCGELEYYDKVYDRISVKTAVPLEKTRRAFRNVTTSEDPVIRRLAAEDKARVFATDAVLTTLMCVKSSVYSWDILVTKQGNKLFFDKRGSSALNLITVNETAPDPVADDKDSLNGMQQLALEATAINQNFSQQVLAKGADKLKFEQPNPFAADEEELASCAYRYRRWRLNEESGVDMIVRCELDGVINVKGEDLLLSIKALNEFDQRAQDWRKKLESQRGAVLAFETKNNKCKMARWTASALLAGADMVKLGYVSRQGPRDNLNHVILDTQVCKPKDFAAQINLNMDHCWGVVRALVDMLLRIDGDGKFLLVKDPNKELLRVYSVPADAFETNYADDSAAAEDAPAEPKSAARAADADE